MRVTALKLANLRAIQTAEFCFQAGFNLILGVRSVAWTCVLSLMSSHSRRRGR